MDNFKKGDWNALCDRCHQTFKASELKKDWQGYRLCKDDWERRNELDFIKPRKEGPAIPWTRPDDTEHETTTDTDGSVSISASLTNTIHNFSLASASGSFSRDSIDVGTDTITEASHGLLNNYRVKWPINAPAGTANDTWFYVINKTTDTFQISTTPGGSVVNIQSASTASITYESYGAVFLPTANDSTFKGIDITFILNNTGDSAFNIVCTGGSAIVGNIVVMADSTARVRNSTTNNIWIRE